MHEVDAFASFVFADVETFRLRICLWEALDFQRGFILANSIPSLCLISCFFTQHHWRLDDWWLTEALLRISWLWISKHSIVTVGSSSGCDIKGDIFPLHRLLERGKFGACASSLIIFLSEEHCTSRLTRTPLEFIGAMIWLLGITFISSSFLESDFVEVVCSLDPGGSAHAELLYQILISVQIAFCLLLRYLRRTISEPTFADSMLQKMLLCLIVSIWVGSPGSPGIIELLVIASSLFFSQCCMTRFDSQFLDAPSDPVLLGHGNISESKMSCEILISLQVAYCLFISHVGPSFSM